VVNHIIDLDKNPFVPEDWKVEEHIKGGELEWDPAKVALYLSEEQQGDKMIQGHQLREELKGKPVYNANLLDYLLKNPQLIPGEWECEAVFFWGTIYRDQDNSLCVRCLNWSGVGWYGDHSWLDYEFIAANPAAVGVFVSSS